MLEAQGDMTLDTKPANETPKEKQHVAPTLPPTPEEEAASLEASRQQFASDVPDINTFRSDMRLLRKSDRRGFLKAAAGGIAAALWGKAVTSDVPITGTSNSNSSPLLDTTQAAGAEYISDIEKARINGEVLQNIIPNVDNILNHADAAHVTIPGNHRNPDDPRATDEQSLTMAILDKDNQRIAVEKQVTANNPLTKTYVVTVFNKDMKTIMYIQTKLDISADGKTTRPVTTYNKQVLSDEELPKLGSDGIISAQSLFQKPSEPITKEDFSNAAKSIEGATINKELTTSAKTKLTR